MHDQSYPLPKKKKTHFSLAYMAVHLRKKANINSLKFVAFYRMVCIRHLSPVPQVSFSPVRVCSDYSLRSLTSEEGN